MKSTPVLIFCLHYLGGSAREWSEVAKRLDPSIQLMGIDLPGFGRASAHGAYSVDAMADAVGAAIRSHQPAHWLLVGHSMGGKVAALLARRAEEGTLDCPGLLGLILLAASPPGPEPMTDEKRATMTSWFRGDEATSRTQANQYVSDNVGDALSAARHALAVDDVLSADRSAWLAWLESGSKEDWSARIATIRLPTLIVTGSADEGLGLDAQRRETAPHFDHLRMVDLQGAGHLLPLERPDDIAALIEEHVARVMSARSVKAEASDALSNDYAALIHSNRVGRGTREALLARGEVDVKVHTPQALSSEAFATLRAVIDRVIPQRGRPIDLAARLDQQLASGGGDGWRSALLPEDGAAYQAALATLNHVAHERWDCPFTALNAQQQDALLRLAADGTLECQTEGVAKTFLDGQQMQAWFADLRADATRLYMAHPDTLAHIGYSGIANGGDGLPKSGFVRLGVDQREAWEPVAFVGEGS